MPVGEEARMFMRILACNIAGQRPDHIPEGPDESLNAKTLQLLWFQLQLAANIAWRTASGIRKKSSCDRRYRT